MPAHLVFPPLVVWLAFLAVPDAPGGPQEVPDRHPRTDRHGDPLPAGAVARLGATRLRHTYYVEAVAFSPDGKLIASAGADREVRLWSAAGRRLRVLKGHTEGIEGV